LSFEGCECLGLTQRPWQTVQESWSGCSESTYDRLVSSYYVTLLYSAVVDFVMAIAILSASNNFDRSTDWLNFPIEPYHIWLVTDSKKGCLRCKRRSLRAESVRSIAVSTRTSDSRSQPPPAADQSTTDAQ